MTNLKLASSLAAEVEQLAGELEGLNPNIYPLVHAPQLLQGSWSLLYSTAKEIRSLDSLPLGLRVSQIYQVIDIGSKSFFNLAFIKHTWGVISGYLKVTATFEAIKANGARLPDKRINVYFDKRFLSIQKIMGVYTPQLDPFQIFQVSSHQNKTPYLDITYLDEDFRIGRGGNGSLFILIKSDSLPECNY